MGVQKTEDGGPTVDGGEMLLGGILGSGMHSSVVWTSLSMSGLESVTQKCSSCQASPEYPHAGSTVLLRGIQWLTIR